MAHLAAKKAAIERAKAVTVTTNAVGEEMAPFRRDDDDGSSSGDSSSAPRRGVSYLDALSGRDRALRWNWGRFWRKVWGAVKGVVCCELD